MSIPSDQQAYMNEDKYQDLFNSLPDLIHFIDLSGRILQVNQSWLRVSGYELAEVQGKLITDFIAEAGSEKFTDYCQAIINGTAQPGELEISIMAKAGHVVHLQGFISLRKKEGQPAYTCGIFRDISSNIFREKQLREKELNVDQLLANAPDAVVVIDPESRIIFWNPKATLLFGWHSEEVIGADLADKIIPPQYREAHRKGMSRYLTTGEAHVLNRTVDISAIKKDGSEFYISLTIANTKQNRQPAFIAFIRDTSEQKALQAESEQRKRQLEISNEQLEQFAHVASHDMKEPVRKIMLFSERLEKEFQHELSEQGKSYLARINNSAERLRNIIDGFLNYANVNNFQDAYDQIHLATILAQIATDLEIMMSEKQARLIYGDMPRFEAVPFLIYQLLYNLLYNALKFSRPGVPAEVRISAALHPRTAFPDMPPGAGASLIEIRIADNGMGFDMEYAETIFKSFVRLNARKDYEGTGLGLTLCKNIVERHDGHISAEGVPGHGAVFTVLLPLNKIA